jgi:hypothetical protein
MANKDQVEIAKQIQEMLLENFLEILSDGTITSTDRATIVRWLTANGWSVDETDAADDLRELIKQSRSNSLIRNAPTTGDEEDAK